MIVGAAVASERPYVMQPPSDTISDVWFRSPAELAEIGPGEITINVRQIGDAGASRPTELVLTI